MLRVPAGRDRTPWGGPHVKLPTFGSLRVAGDAHSVLWDLSSLRSLYKDYNIYL